MKLLVFYKTIRIIFLICNSANIIRVNFLKINKKRLLTSHMLCVFDLENCRCQAR